MANKTIYKLGLGLVLSTALTGAAMAQTTTTTTTTQKQVVQNADGSWTVIEYPVGKEVMVDLTPFNISGAKGMARIMRMADGTKVAVDLSGLPADSKNYYVYAVDPSGAVTLLGPTMVSNGVSTATFSTPMDKFMIVLSPNEGLTTLAADTPVVFRSSIPSGYAVVPAAVTSMNTNEKQVAVSTPINSAYDVPLLNVPSFGNRTTEIRVNFSGDLAGLKGKAYVKPRKDGTAQIKMRFDDMKMAPKEKRYVLWAVSPDKQYTKIGQIINTGARQEAEIRGETALKDFGLFVTLEDTDVTAPNGTVYAPFVVGLM